MVLECFMWMWIRVVYTELENMPLLEEPWEDGVVVRPSEVQGFHRVRLPSSACIIPGAGCPEEISWLWLCYWDTNVQILRSKLRARSDT